MAHRPTPAAMLTCAHRQQRRQERQQQHQQHHHNHHRLYRRLYQRSAMPTSSSYWPQQQQQRCAPPPLYISRTEPTTPTACDHPFARRRSICAFLVSSVRSPFSKPTSHTCHVMPNLRTPLCTLLSPHRRIIPPSSFVPSSPLSPLPSSSHSAHRDNYHPTTPTTTTPIGTTPTASLQILSPTVLLLIGGAVAFLLSAALGANDVANSLGTAVGTGAVRVSTALAIGFVMEFLGAVLFGSTVTRTISSGVVAVSAATLSSPALYMSGMLSVLVGCTAWMTVATTFGLPVSSTHSVVGSLIGLGIISGWGISTNAVLRIVSSWFISPIVGGVVSLIIYNGIILPLLNAKKPGKAARRALPALAAGVSFILGKSILSHGAGAKFEANGFKPDQLVYLLVAASLACTGAVASMAVMTSSPSSLKPNENGNGSDDISETSTPTTSNSDYNATSIQTQAQQGNDTTEKEYEVNQLFKILQILTACLLSFSHGSNDVSNAIGPFAAMYTTWKNMGNLSAMSTAAAGAIPIPFWVLLLGGFGISVGLGLFGRPVMQTVGQKITVLKPPMGFCVEFSTALTVLVASRLGLPVSTTHTLIGCIVAVGLAQGGAGKKNINRGVIASIAASWGVTLPFSALVTVLFYLALKPFVLVGIPALP